MRHFCIYTNSHKDKDLTVTGFIRAYFEERGIACSAAVGQDARIPEDADCVLALGGDGTMLQAARAVGGRHGVSLLGINMGTLGYLTEVEPDGIAEALGQVLAGDYELESRMMLNGTVHRKTGSGARICAQRHCDRKSGFPAGAAISSLCEQKTFE